MIPGKCAIDNLTIEVTRRCNLSCIHCFRGDTQGIDIAYRDLDKLFSMIYEVNQLIITGGEPSLAVNRIRYIIQLIQKNNIIVHGVTVISNGLTDCMDDFLDVMAELYALSITPMQNYIAVSIDYFHGSAEQCYENFDKGMKNWMQLKSKATFPLTIHKGSMKVLKAVGRAKSNSLEKAIETFPIINKPILIHEDSEDLIIQELTINAKGSLGTFSDCSYQDEDLTENQICNISEVQCIIDLLKMIDIWNKKKSVQVIGVLWVIAHRINAGCVTCSYFKETYFYLINKAAAIIESEDFKNLSLKERELLLDALQWENHKDYVINMNNISLDDMCNWWEEADIVTNPLKLLKKIADNQIAIYKKVR